MGENFWSDFIVQTLAGLAVAAIITLIGYARSEHFRKWIKLACKKVIVTIKWWGRQWRYNLAILLVLLLEITIYLFIRSLLAIALSLLHLILIAILYRLFQIRSNEPRVTSSIPQELLKTLKADSSKIRLKAVKALGELSGPEVLKHLLAAANDTSPGVKTAAIEEIEKIRSNSSVILDQPAVLTSLLGSRRWLLIFGFPDESKPITFLENGEIGEGRNSNEHTWRIQNKKLELIQEDGNIHSRFSFDKNTQSFFHTNDQDTRSRKNQIIYMK